MAVSMYTEADLQALADAIKQNAQEVTFADGRKVKFSTYEELVSRFNFVARMLGHEVGRQRLLAEYRKGVTP